MVAHYSEWFATRAEIRKVILGKALPNVGTLVTVLAWQKPRKLQEEDVLRLAPPRLRELKALCDSYGVHLAILVPPAIAADHAEVLASLAESDGIPVVVPAVAGSMDQALFRDTLHLNAAGAAIFTTKLENQLPSSLYTQ